MGPPDVIHYVASTEATNPAVAMPPAAIDLNRKTSVVHNPFRFHRIGSVSLAAAALALLARTSHADGPKITSSECVAARDAIASAHESERAGHGGDALESYTSCAAQVDCAWLASKRAAKLLRPRQRKAAPMVAAAAAVAPETPKAAPVPLDRSPPSPQSPRAESEPYSRDSAIRPATAQATPSPGTHWALPRSPLPYTIAAAGPSRRRRPRARAPRWLASSRCPGAF